MSDYRQAIAECLDEARRQSGYGDFALECCEEAVRLADRHRDLDLGFEARLELIELSCFSGRPKDMLTAFAWCLAQVDQHPARFDEAHILWTYKWAIEEAVAFHEIEREQIEEMIQDLSRRFEQVGAGSRSEYHLRCKVATVLGDREAAEHFERLWQRAPHDWLSDCPACDADTHAHVLFWLERNAEAYRAAAPIFHGTLRCAEVPHRTHARVLLPLFMEGRFKEALQHHRLGYPLLQNGRKLSARLADHLLFLTLTSNYDQALALVSKHLPNARNFGSPYEGFIFEYATVFLLDELIQGGEKQVRLCLPESLFGQAENDVRDVKNLCESLRKRCRSVASHFAMRNSNESPTSWMTSIDRLHREVIQMPISKSSDCGSGDS